MKSARFKERMESLGDPGTSEPKPTSMLLGNLALCESRPAIDACQTNWPPPHVANLRQRFESLTPREREVISMLVSGLLNKQISGRLRRSENTVKVHRGRAMKKIQAQSLPDLVRIMEELKNSSQ